MTTREQYEQQIADASTHKDELMRKARGLHDTAAAAHKEMVKSYDAYMASGKKPTMKDLISAVSQAHVKSQAELAARGPEPSPSVVDAIAKSGRSGNADHNFSQAFRRRPPPKLPSQK